MTTERPAENAATPPEGSAAPSADEIRFIARLLDELAEVDVAAHEALLECGADLVACAGEADRLGGRIRSVLTGQSSSSLTPARKELKDRTTAALARYGEPATPSAADKPTDEPDGILTALTRQLPPEKAVELYRKITPVFVYQLLQRINGRASLDVVHCLVDHLCSDEVQARLRSCDHVREGILDECCIVLARSELRRSLTRDELQRMLEECGAMSDLVAMENCLKLASAMAG